MKVVAEQEVERPFGQPVGAPAGSNPQAVSSEAAHQAQLYGDIVQVDRDAILMEVAGWIEEGDFRVLAGILSKRKREREDADLRVKTSNDVRKRMADMIRGRMQNKVGDPIDFLEDVKAGRHDRYCTGFILRQAIALADKGLLVVTVTTQVAGPHNNTVGGNTAYLIAITERGEKVLAQATADRP